MLYKVNCVNYAICKVHQFGYMYRRDGIQSLLNLYTTGNQIPNGILKGRDLQYCIKGHSVDDI